ncbi:MAG TPA: glycosyltransferase, partial [Pyrinomonadaceae bacterium]|nr:glycosyltransferase [Pyrinomonadaceae bacterium]
GDPQLKFIIVGDGHMKEELEAEAARLNLTDVVSFLGNRPDTETVYAGADIVALTSLNEGTPLSLIEGMASERAVISTVVGGVGDLLGEVDERVDGFQIHERGVGIPGNEVAEFTNGLIYLAKDEKLRLRLARAGREFVHSNYGKDRLVSDIKSLYRNLIK